MNRGNDVEGPMEKEYLYRVSAAATAARNGVASAEGVASPIAFSTPPEFQGEAGQWTPEYLFLASVAGCFVSTFSGIAHFSKFAFLSLTVDAEGALDREEHGWRFIRITLHPRLKIPQGKDRERAVRLLEKAEKACLIARSINSKVIAEPELVVEGEAQEREKAEELVPIR
ncbi:MAG: OsmC family protein [Candidatus Acidiferrales bacterium]